MRGNANKVATSIDGNSDAASISNHFSKIYKDLFNSVPSDDKVKDLLKIINEELTDDDLQIIDLVDSELIKEAIGKLKTGKSDCSFDFGSDAYINASETLSTPIAFLFKTFLIHGSVPNLLLMCSLVPIIKDKLGEKNNSDNYRAIAISSLLLKIFDHVILLLFKANLKACDMQFGFLENNSTSMCTWIVTEVISYYVRNQSSVFCCLLDLKKAFDKVEFSKL